MKKNVPNPGSEEAQEQGCICPVEDNNYGEGFKWGNNQKCFWMTDGCPLHDNSEEWEVNSDLP